MIWASDLRDGGAAVGRSLPAGGENTIKNLMHILHFLCPLHVHCSLHCNESWSVHVASSLVNGLLKGPRFRVISMVNLSFKMQCLPVSCMLIMWHTKLPIRKLMGSLHGMHTVSTNHCVCVLALSLDYNADLILCSYVWYGRSRAVVLSSRDSADQLNPGHQANGRVAI